MGCEVLKSCEQGILFQSPLGSGVVESRFRSFVVLSNTAMDKSKCFLTLNFSIVQTRRDECSAILYQYPVLCPSALIIVRIRSGMLLTKLEHVDRGVLSHSSARNCLNSAMLRGKRCSIRRLRSPHRSSIGLRFGEWGGSLIKSTPLL